MEPTKRETELMVKFGLHTSPEYLQAAQCTPPPPAASLTCHRSGSRFPLCCGRRVGRPAAACIAPQQSAPSPRRPSSRPPSLPGSGQPPPQRPLRHVQYYIAFSTSAKIASPYWHIVRYRVCPRNISLFLEPHPCLRSRP